MSNQVNMRTVSHLTKGMHLTDILYYLLRASGASAAFVAKPDPVLTCLSEIYCRALSHFTQFHGYKKWEMDISLSHQGQAKLSSFFRCKLGIKRDVTERGGQIHQKEQVFHSP